jgi:hypothetical protein
MGNGEDEWEVRWEARKGAVGSGNSKGEASEGAVGNATGE